MSSSHFGDEPAKRPYSPKVQANSDSRTGCSFCWFVLTVYPTLNGMTEGDRVAFREHLKKAHGLKKEIGQ